MNNSINNVSTTRETHQLHSVELKPIKNNSSEPIHSTEHISPMGSPALFNSVINVENLEKCGFNVKDSFNNLNDLRGLIMPAAGNVNSMYDIILSDNFYKRVEKLVNSIDRPVNFADQPDDPTNKFKCIIKPAGDKGKTELCKHIMTSERDLHNIFKMAEVVDKYDGLIKKMLVKIYNFAIEAQSTCNLDVENMHKLRKLISKINLLLVDDQTLHTICKNNMYGSHHLQKIEGYSSAYDHNDSSSYFMTGCVIVLLIFLLYVYSSK